MMRFDQAQIRSTKRTYSVCLACDAVHYYHPLSDQCQGCGRVGTLMDSKTEDLAITPSLEKLRDKLRRLPCLFQKPEPEIQGDETMAKAKAKKVVKKAKKASANAIPHGRTLGMRIQETWIHLFEENEKASRAKKRTDEQLRKFMLSEFPTVDSKLFNLLREGVLHRVQAVRARYNRGGMTGGNAPKVQSHRYDEQGNYADPKFSGKAGVLLDDLDSRYTLPAAESHRPAKKVKKPAKKKVVKKVVKVKRPKAPPAASEASDEASAG